MDRPAWVSEFWLGLGMIGKWRFACSRHQRFLFSSRIVHHTNPIRFVMRLRVELFSFSVQAELVTHRWLTYTEKKLYVNVTM